MASTLWTGSISFGLVTIPVSLVTAEVREELDFTLLDRRDDSPIGYQKISKRTGKPVPADQIVRGFEYQDGRYVVLSDADLRRASPERTQRIDVVSFVRAAEIPPVYFDRPYYLEPARGGERGYALFREALRRSGRVAIATVVVKTRQHLAAIVVQDRALVLDLLRYAAELRDPSRLRVPGPGLKGISEREIKMAERLIDEMTEPWKPERYRDEYRDELMAFIKKRSRAGKLAAAPETEEEPARRPRADVIDIADLLRKSLAGKGARGPSKPSEAPRRHRRRKTA
jgi:DNA end-binding protein Ku